MKTFASVIIVASLFVTGVTGASVAMRAEHHPHAAQNLKDAKWSPAPPLLPKGAEIAVLDGDPTKPAPYTVRLRFPANYAIPAHSHPTDENVVVTSGALTFGMGDALAKKAAGNKTLGVGGYALMPANMNHYACTAAQATTIVLYGQGPVEFKYVKASDDPRHKG